MTLSRKAGSYIRRFGEVERCAPQRYMALRRAGGSWVRRGSPYGNWIVCIKRGIFMKKLREGLNGMKVLSLPSFSIVVLTPKLLQSSQATGEVYGGFHERIL